jgi:hypothetical protein
LKPLPRVYLAAALAALGLGAYVVGRQLVAPVPPAKSGCLETQFDSAVAGQRLPWARIQLFACPHFDETTLDLWIDAPFDSTDLGGLVFRGSGPRDPHRWPQYLRVRWLNEDSLLVEHTAEIHFLDRRDSAGAIRILYHERAGESH